MMTYWEEGGGWICRSSDELTAAWGKTKEDATANMWEKVRLERLDYYQRLRKAGLL